MQVLHLLRALGVAMRLLLRFELQGGRVVAGAEAGVDLDIARDRLPLLAQRVPLAADVVIRRVLGERLDLGHEGRQPLGGLPGKLTTLEALFGGAAGFAEPALELGGPRLRHRRHAFPRGARLRHAVSNVVAVQALDARAHRRAIGLFLFERAALAFGVGARRFIGGEPLAHHVRGILEIGFDGRLDVGVGKELDPGDAPGRIRFAQLREVGRR
jgi:hypothetical protein